MIATSMLRARLCSINASRCKSATRRVVTYNVKAIMRIEARNALRTRTKIIKFAFDFQANRYVLVPIDKQEPPMLPSRLIRACCLNYRPRANESPAEVIHGSARSRVWPAVGTSNRRIATHARDTSAYDVCRFLEQAYEITQPENRDDRTRRKRDFVENV